MVCVIVAAMFGASAYTSSSVKRAGNMNVVNDDTGLLALDDGTSGNLITQNQTGALNIDFTKGGATGVNTEAHFEFGNPSDPTNQTAFNITNLDAEPHDITVSYTGAQIGDSDANVQFQIYDDTGTPVATVSEESTSATLKSVSSGTTYYVVLVVDTYGVDSSTDFSGTLEFSV